MNQALLSSERHDWETPDALFFDLDNEFHFETDACALPHNAKCERYFSPEDDGLAQEWTGVCWCNPPYGREIGKWVRKAAESDATTVMLIPARTDTAWFHNYVLGRAEIRFLRGRIRFVGATWDAPFPSMVVIFRGEGRHETD